MVERKEPEQRFIRPETTDLNRQAEPLGDGVERDQPHPPGAPSHRESTEQSEVLQRGFGTATRPGFNIEKLRGYLNKAKSMRQADTHKGASMSLQDNQPPSRPPII